MFLIFICDVCMYLKEILAVYGLFAKMGLNGSSVIFGVYYKRMPRKGELDVGLQVRDN